MRGLKPASPAPPPHEAGSQQNRMPAAHQSESAIEFNQSCRPPGECIPDTSGRRARLGRCRLNPAASKRHADPNEAARESPAPAKRLKEALLIQFHN